MTIPALAREADISARPNAMFAAALLAVLLLVAGCASQRDVFRALATAGVDSTTTLEEALRQKRKDLTRHVESLAISAALTDAPRVTDDEQKRVEALRRALGARAQAFSDLQKTYTALHALAAYDAAEEVATASTGLLGAISNYASTVGATGVPVGVQPLIDRSARLLADFIQSKKLRKAGAAIRGSLEPLTKVMEAELTAWGALDALLATSGADATRDLFRLGIGTPSAMLRTHLETNDFDFDAAHMDEVLAPRLELITGPASSQTDAERIRRENERRERRFNEAVTRAGKLRVAVDRVVVLRTEERITLHKAALAKSIDALKELAEEHRKLEERESLDLARVTSILAVIRGYAEDAAALRRTPASDARR